MTGREADRREVSRRAFVAGTGAVAAGVMLGPLMRAPAVAAAACRGAPPAFPAGIPLRRDRFETWSKEIAVDGLWAATPRTAREVCVLADWARSQGWVLRPRGMMHTWSPLTVGPTADCSDRVVLVDTAPHLNRVEIVATAPGEVTAEAGVLVEAVAARMEEAGLGFTQLPAIGSITIGGALAVDAHGATLPAAGEQPPPGAGFGSLSDLVVSLTAVVWSPRHGRYVLRTFDRSDRRCDALMVHLGRAFITEVTLRAVRNQRLRCVSRVDIPAAELFAAPGSRGRTFTRMLDASGRAEAIWYPFTESPWLKVWSVAPSRPPSSRAVSGPYNYPFSDNVPDALAELADEVVTGRPELTPAFGRMLYAATAAGLAGTASMDLWGWSKDVNLYIKPTTLRVAELGYGVLCARADVQWVIHAFTTEYARRLRVAARAGRYPINMPLDLRVSGLDDARAVGVEGARPPLLSALGPVRRRPDWNCVVWVNVLDLTGTRDAPAFKAGLERWTIRTFDGTRALARAEWSKGWAFGDTGPWQSERLAEIAAPYGRRRTSAGRTLRALDPHGVFGSPLSGSLLGA